MISSSTTTQETTKKLQGLSYNVKSTFLHFDDKLEDDSFPRVLRRSASCPAGLRMPATFTTKDTSPIKGDSVNWDNVTSIMIKNLPYTSTKEDVLDAIKEIGFEDAHDFFHLPLRRMNSLGYAFIAFPDAQVTKQFVQAMTGYTFPGKRSNKVVALVPARIQGKKGTIAHFKGTSTLRNLGRQMFPKQHRDEGCSQACV